MSRITKLERRLTESEAIVERLKSSLKAIQADRNLAYLGTQERYAYGMTAKAADSLRIMDHQIHLLESILNPPKTEQT